MTPEEYLKRFLPFARNVSERTGLDPRLVLAQSALETGYGEHAPGGNYFGIKSHGRAGGQNLATTEFVNGAPVTANESFRGYASPEQSFNDYADFILGNKRYAPVLGERTLEGQIAAMGKSGYATDPNYGAKLANIASKFNLGGGDALASDTMTSLGLKPQQTEAKPMAGLLGDMPQQQPQAPQKKTFWDSLGPLSDPDRRARLAMALEGMTMNPNQALIQSLGKGIETRAGERKTAEAKNRTLTALQKLGTPQAQRALEYMQAGGDATTALKLAFETQDSRGVVVGGNVVDPVTGRVIYQAPEKETAPNIPAAFLTLDMQARAGGLVPEAEGGDGGYEQFMRTRGAGLAEQAKQEAKTGVEQRAAAPADIAAADDALSLIDSIKNDPARKAATGMSSVLNAIPGTQGYDFNQKVEQLKSGAFMTAIQQLRGMGALSNAEGQTATRAVTRLNTAMTEEGFLDALSEYETIVKNGRKKAAKILGEQGAAPTSTEDMSDDDLLKLYGGQ